MHVGVRHLPDPNVYDRTKLFLSCVDLCQTTLAGLTEPVVQIHTGLMHGTAHHIIADITGTGQEEAQIAGIHGAHGCNGIAFDAGDLHQ